MCFKVVNISRALSWAKRTECTVCVNAEKTEESVTLGTKVVLKEFLMKVVSLGNIEKRRLAHGPRIKISTMFIPLFLSTVQEFYSCTVKFYIPIRNGGLGSGKVKPYQ